MRLSDEKIETLAGEIVEYLEDHPELARLTVPASRLEREVSRFIRADLRIEDEISQEALARMETYSRKVPQGSTEWTILLERHKEEIAARRGYVL